MNNIIVASFMNGNNSHEFSAILQHEIIGCNWSYSLEKNLMGM